MEFSTNYHSIQPDKELCLYWTDLMFAAKIAKKLGYGIASNILENTVRNSYDQWKQKAEAYAKSKTKTSVLGFGVVYSVSSIGNPLENSINDTFISHITNNEDLEKLLNQILEKRNIKREQIGLKAFDYSQSQEYRKAQLEFEWQKSSRLLREQQEADIFNYEEYYIKGLREGQTVQIIGAERVVASRSKSLFCQANSIKNMKELEKFIASHDSEDKHIGLQWAFVIKTIDNDNGNLFYILPSNYRSNFFTLEDSSRLMQKGVLADAWQKADKEGKTMEQIVMAILSNLKNKILFVHLEYIKTISRREKTLVYLYDR